MKKFYLMLLFLCSSKNTINGMLLSDSSTPIKSLAYLAAKNISKRIEKTIKACLSANRPAEEIGEITSGMVLCLTEPTKEMIHNQLLLKYAKKVFTRKGHHIIQYFDGRQLTKTERLNPKHPSNIDASRHCSPWSKIELCEFIKQYCIVYYAHKNKNPQHPLHIPEPTDYAAQLGRRGDTPVPVTPLSSAIPFSLAL